MPNYVLVARSRASAIFYPGTSLIANFQYRDWAPFVLLFRTRFEDRGFEAKVPTSLLVEARGIAPDIRQAVDVFTNAAHETACEIGFCVNAAMGQVEKEIVYDASADSEEHEFLQSHFPDWPIVAVPTRRIYPTIVGKLIEALRDHSERDRLMRAIGQYSEALQSWHPARQLTCVSHLYMGVGALTKAVLRQHCAKVGKSEDELVADWGIEKKKLDSEVRVRLIFGGDADSFKKAKDVSDAFEHGYKDFEDIRQPAKEVILKIASYLRHSIIELLNLEKAVTSTLLSPPYNTPRGPLRVAKYLRGKFIGKADDLAAKGQDYPILDWRCSLQNVRVTENGEYESDSQQTLTAVIGNDAKVITERAEAWDHSTIAAPELLTKQWNP